MTKYSNPNHALTPEDVAHYVGCTRQASAVLIRVLAERGLTADGLLTSLNNAGTTTTTERGTRWALGRALAGEGASSAIWLDLCAVLALPLDAFCADPEWQNRCRSASASRAAMHRQRTEQQPPLPLPAPETPPVPEATSTPTPTTTHPSISDLAAKLTRLEMERTHIERQIQATKEAMRAALA